MIKMYDKNQVLVSKPKLKADIFNKFFFTNIGNEITETYNI